MFVCACTLSQLFGDYCLFLHETKNWREGNVPRCFFSIWGEFSSHFKDFWKQENKLIPCGRWLFFIYTVAFKTGVFSGVTC